MKNVVAMLNSEGGEILIGINDDRTLRGIDNERDGLARYAARNGEKAEPDDLYLQIFDQMIVRYIGKSTLKYVKPRLWTYQKRTILIIQVHASPEAASLKIGKDGSILAQSEYWIRGNSGDRRMSPSALGRVQNVATKWNYKR